MTMKTAIDAIPRRITGADDDFPAKTDKEESWNSLSEIGQIVFHPECSRCSWRDETYTFVESLAQAEKHRDETGHRPIPIYFDTLRNFMLSVK